MKKPLAIVTGHSRGLGAAIAGELLQRGIAVLALSRSGNADLAGRFPERLQEIRLDLSDSAALLDWLATPQLADALKDVGLAMLVNNAASLQPVAMLGSQDARLLARAIALNVTAPLLLSNAVAAHTHQADERRLLHLSSGAARKPYAGWSVYCASKAALDQHARACMQDVELGGLRGLRGLRIASLAPGVIDTGMQAEIRASAEQDFPLRQHFERLHADGQLSRPEDCARNLVDYLLGDCFAEPEVFDLRER